MIRRTFTAIADVYDRMNRLLSLGLDQIWRRQATRLVDGNPTAILDFACGTGDLMFALARRFPNARIVGIDITPAMLKIARRKNHSENLAFVEANAQSADDLATACHSAAQHQEIQLVSCAFGFRNFDDRKAALRNARAFLKPGGQLLVLEFFRPIGHLRRTMTDLWLLLMARLFAPARRKSYDYLRSSMKRTVCECEFIAQAQLAGFKLRKKRFYLPCCSALLFDVV